MNPCKRGHDMDVVGQATNGQCRLCHREVDARVHRTSYHAKPGWWHSQELLRKRRQKALRRIEQRSNQEA